MKKLILAAMVMALTSPGLVQAQQGGQQQITCSVDKKIDEGKSPLEVKGVDKIYEDCVKLKRYQARDRQGANGQRVASISTVISSTLQYISIKSNIQALEFNLGFQKAEIQKYKDLVANAAPGSTTVTVQDNLGQDIQVPIDRVNQVIQQMEQGVQQQEQTIASVKAASVTPEDALAGLTPSVHESLTLSQLIGLKESFLLTEITTDEYFNSTNYLGKQISGIDQPEDARSQEIIDSLLVMGIESISKGLLDQLLNASSAGQNVNDYALASYINLKVMVAMLKFDIYGDGSERTLSTEASLAIDAAEKALPELEALVTGSEKALLANYDLESIKVAILDAVEKEREEIKAAQNAAAGNGNNDLP